jgi:cold-inducible RNA-binding protein
MNIYVGNLPYSATDGDLQELFSAHGTVDKASVIMDRDTGRSKGFGFVEMGDNGEAQNAIKALDGSPLNNRNLKVNEARPRDSKPKHGRY